MFSPNKKDLKNLMKLTVQEISAVDKEDDPEEILEIRNRLVQVVKEMDEKLVFGGSSVTE